MSSPVKVVISNKQKTVKIPSGIRLLVRRCCHATLLEEKLLLPAEVSVSFVNDAQIWELNKTYRQKDSPTDVLSFPTCDDGKSFDTNPESGTLLLGDIVISVERAMEQAQTYGHSLQREIGFLTVHSMLHLLGYDHEAGGLAQVRMREKEEQVLTALGLSIDNSYVLPDEASV